MSIEHSTNALRTALGSVVIGQEDAMDELIAAWLAGGHVLLEGVPGVAKTLLARTLAAALGLDFGRVQFTPDLMPADITGGSIFDFKGGAFQLQKGPLFCQVLLADEINRAPPKTQAALLEAMQERQATIDGESHPLDPGFFVVATQNPIDQEGTYPLPEAQLDRFLLRVEVGYPEPDAELEVYRRFRDGALPTDGRPPALTPVVDAAGVESLRASLRDVHVEDGVLLYVQQLVAATRAAPRLVWGASPRAGLALLRASRAWAAMEGRDFVIPDDIKRMAAPVLTHRLLPTADAELDGWSARRVLDGILQQVAVPR
jgi:MoxR-like ATPase